MKRILLAAAALLAAASSVLNAQSREDRLKEHLYYLASDEMNGRGSGTEDAAKAAEYILGKYQEIGLQPFFESGWYQPFERFTHKDRNFKNIVACIPGSDPELKDEYIVIGAHYDHLGFKKGQVYNGADDNASGSAALIEIARILKAEEANLKRTVVIAAFDGEELGLFGSNELANQMDSLINADKVKLMISVDMVGWLEKGKTLKLEGTSTIMNGKLLLAAQAKNHDIEIKAKKFETSVLTATDTQGFAEKGVPTLAVTTGLKSPYHKPGDDPELIDYPGLDKVTAYMADVVGYAASTPGFAGSGELAPKHGGKTQKVEFSLLGGIGSSNLDFPDAAFTGKSAGAYAAGAQLILNTKNSLAFRLAGLFNWEKALYPDASDLFHSSLKYKSQSVSVPLDVLVKFGQGGSSFYIGCGPMYRYNFSQSIAGEGIEEYVTPSQVGFSWIFGWNLGHITMAFEGMSPGKIRFIDDTMPRISSYSALFMLGYKF